MLENEKKIRIVTIISRLKIAILNKHLFKVNCLLTKKTCQKNKSNCHPHDVPHTHTTMTKKYTVNFFVN